MGQTGSLKDRWSCDDSGPVRQEQLQLAPLGRQQVVAGGLLSLPRTPGTPRGRGQRKQPLLLAPHITKAGGEGAFQALGVG